MPSYPNWQRKRTQNPSSVGSNPTEGTMKTQESTRNEGTFAALQASPEGAQTIAHILAQAFGPWDFADSMSSNGE